MPYLGYCQQCYNKHRSVSLDILFPSKSRAMVAAQSKSSGSSLHFIEIVSKELGVDKKDIYVNTSATTDGAIIKVGDNFYRAISGTDQDSYLLEKMELYKSDVELVEVEK